MALSVGFSTLVSLGTALATGLLTFALTGLSPADQPSIGWTQQFSEHPRNES